MATTSNRASALLLLLACLFGGIAPAQAAAIVDEADIVVNFGSIVFRNAGGEAIVDGIDVEAADAFNVTSDVEIGNASAETTGTADACTIAECDIVSIYPLRITTSVAADAPPLSRAIGTGRADGLLSFTNNTGSDLTIDFFLEIDVFWSGLSVDDPSSELASLSWLVGFEYNGVVTEVVNASIDGDQDGVSVGDVCPEFPNDLCNLRESFEGLSLPAGATRSFAGFAELTALAEVANGELPLPSTLHLLGLLPALVLLAGRRRRPAP